MAYTLRPQEVLTADITRRFLPADEVLLPPYAVDAVRFTAFLATLPKHSLLPDWLTVNATGGLAAVADLPAHTVLLARKVPREAGRSPKDTDLRVRQMTTFYYGTVPFHVCIEGAPVVARVPLDDVWARISYAVMPNTTKVEIMDTAWQVYVCVVTSVPLSRGTPLTMTR